MDITSDDAKRAARALRRALEDDGLAISHARALEVVAQQLGHRDWNTASALLSRSGPALGAPVPVLRVQEWGVAEAFYRDYLGFAVEWVHRFEADLPAYARVRRDGATLDLSEHHGDGTPGTVLWVPVADLARLHRELRGRPGPLRPGIDADAPGGPTMTVTDPFGNVLRLCEAGGTAAPARGGR